MLPLAILTVGATLAAALGLAWAGTEPSDYERGREAQRRGEAEAAIVAYDRCLAATPQNADCHWEMGWSYWSLGQWDRVITHWEAVQKLDPAREKLPRYLAEARTNLEAVVRMRAAAATAPDLVRPPIPAGKTVRLRAVGDVMMGSDFPDTSLMPPDDGVHLLDAVAPLLLDADLTIANLEGPLCDGGTTDKCGPGDNCYAFRTPTHYGQYLAAVNLDFASTANNHAGDFGETCRRQTEQTLDGLGIAWSGAPGTIATRELGGLKVGFIAFHTSPSVNNVNDHESAAALVRVAKQTHDWVVVMFHGGAEGAKAMHVPAGEEMFYGENRGDLRTFARKMVEAGADIVIGSGPHVPRGMEVIDGHLVAYSLGNFATYGRFNLSGSTATSLVLEAQLDAQGKLVSGRILPTHQEGKGLPSPDPTDAAIDLVRMLSEEDFPTTAPRIGKDGTIVPR